jgi:hypothetical protein
MEDAMVSKTTSNAAGEAYPGMMGDGTEEQNLGQIGNPKARISEADVDQAFARPAGERRSFKGDSEPSAGPRPWMGLKEGADAAWVRPRPPGPGRSHGRPRRGGSRRTSPS